MTKEFCDRCGNEIKGTQYGKADVVLAVNESNHASWQHPLKFTYCFSCAYKIEKYLQRKAK